MPKDNVQELRPRPPESEKITINLGYVDLGQIDLLVKEGFYSNRTDLPFATSSSGTQTSSNRRSRATPSTSAYVTFPARIWKKYELQTSSYMSGCSAF